MRRIVSSPLAGLLATSLAVWVSPQAAQAAAPSRPLPAMAVTAGVPGPLAAIVGPEEEEEDELVIEDDEMEGGAPEGAADGDADTPAPDEDMDLFGDGDGDDPIDGGDRKAGEAPGKLDPESEESLIKNEMGLIVVVQRQRMLKKKRFEIAPQFGLTINDPYVRHYTLGLDLNYWLTNRMAIGLTGTGFIGDRTARYDNVRFQEGLLLTANKTLWQGSLNFTYNPFYGKISIFNRALLHWEVATTIGAGATQTQVIPRYEAIHDPFNTITGGGVVGLLARTYLPKIDWMSYEAGVRFWVYPDKLEPGRRGPATAAGEPDDVTLDDAGNAKDAAEFKVAFNVTVFLGVSFFFPTSFKYSTPR